MEESVVGGGKIIFIKNNNLNITFSKEDKLTLDQLNLMIKDSIITLKVENSKIKLDSIYAKIKNLIKIAGKEFKNLQLNIPASPVFIKGHWKTNLKEAQNLYYLSLICEYNKYITNYTNIFCTFIIIYVLNDKDKFNTFLIIIDNRGFIDNFYNIDKILSKNKN